MVARGQKPLCAPTALSTDVLLRAIVPDATGCRSHSLTREQAQESCTLSHGLLSRLEDTSSGMQELAERLVELYSTSPLVFWVAGSALVSALATNGLWLLRSRGFWGSSYWRWIGEMARFLFFLGIPYLALGGWPRRPFQGLVSLNDMGIVGLRPPWPAARWLQATGTGLALGLIAFSLLLLGWAAANRRNSAYRLWFPPRPWWALLVDVLYLEVHWAFYRAALAVTVDDLYVGTFAGLGVVYLEWALNPFWRQAWRDRSQVAAHWLRSALALVMAVVFLLTHSLWVCLGIHWLIELIFWHVGRERPIPQAA